MTEIEDRFRERRSAHVEDIEKEPASPASGTRASGSPAGTTPAAPAAPESSEIPEVPEGPLFDVVQHIALRAMQCMGEMPLNEAGEQRVLPREAKAYIDLLSRIRNWTRGDLSPQAATALEQILSDLRVRYLEMT